MLMIREIWRNCEGERYTLRRIPGMIVTANGVVSRIKAVDISCQGRPATGVKAQNLGENDTVVSCNKIVNTDSEESGADVASSQVAEAAAESNDNSEQGTLL